MDPEENIRQQEAIANEIVQMEQGGRLPYDRTLMDTFSGRASLLAELVLAGIEWRRKGGFDPFIKKA